MNRREFVRTAGGATGAVATLGAAGPAAAQEEGTSSGGGGDTRDTERLAGILEEAQPVVFNELRTASGQRQFSRALFYAGRVRSAFQKADQTDALDAFDQQLDALLAQAPYSVPPRIRRAYGLASDSAAGQRSMPMQLPGGGGTQPAPSGGGGPSGGMPSGGGGPPSSPPSNE